MESNQGRKSHNLEVIYKNEDHGGDYSEKRRLPRLCIGSQQFKLLHPRKLFSVADLSEKGMALWLLDPDDISHFSIGNLIQGTLNLKGLKYDLDAFVRNLTRDRVGLEIQKISPDFVLALQKFLDPTQLGKELKAFPSSEKHTLWYHGPSGTDFLLRRLTDGQIAEFTFYILGTYVQKNPDGKIQTGRTESAPNGSEVVGILRHESLYLFPDSDPDPEKLAIAKKVLLSSNLSQDFKNRCVRHL